MPEAPATGSGAAGFERRLHSLDVGLYEPIGLPGWRNDPVSLLALHAACREEYETFAYLEIGSYLGSSLQSFVADDRCRTIVSIDPRPPSVPDGRGFVASYPDNTTENMLARLATVPGADLAKVHPLEAHASDVDPARLADRPDLCFVDGEHTHDAALADARFCRAALDGRGAVVFHDRAVVATAIAEFLRELDRDKQSFFAYPLPHALFVVELGGARLVRSELVRRQLSLGRERLWHIANRGPRPSGRIAPLLLAEARARRAAPTCLKRAAAAARDRRRDGALARAPSGVATPDVADRAGAARPRGRDEVSASTRRRLLVIGPEPPPWTGMEVSTLALLRELRNAGIELERVNTADPADSLVNRSRWTVRNVRLALEHVVSASRKAFRRDVSAVYVPISQERPAFYRDALFILVARLARKPVVVHLHGGAFGQFYRSEPVAMRALIRVTVGRASLGIVLSERIRPALECVLPSSRVTPVEIGVDVDDAREDWAPREGDTFRALFLSTLVPEKGLLVFVEAVALAHRDRPHIVGAVAGNWVGGETRAAAERLARELGATEFVSLVGTVTGAEKARLFRESNVFCLPTYYPLEGTPSVVVEAMAAGIPVVATAWAGLPDLVEDGRTGILLDEPSPALLAEKLVLLADRPELRAAMGAAGRARYRERFTQAAFGRRVVAALAPFVGADPDELGAEAQASRNALSEC
jgi:glycosyltransferase involved in cell wall biosynthesis